MSTEEFLAAVVHQLPECACRQRGADGSQGHICYQHGVQAKQQTRVTDRQHTLQYSLEMTVRDVETSAIEHFERLYKLLVPPPVSPQHHGYVNLNKVPLAPCHRHPTLCRCAANIHPRYLRLDLWQ